MESLYIVIPAYNEAENIDACIKDWYPIIEKFSGDGGIPGLLSLTMAQKTIHLKS